MACNVRVFEGEFDSWLDGQIPISGLIRKILAKSRGGAELPSLAYIDTVVPRTIVHIFWPGRQGFP